MSENDTASQVDVTIYPLLYRMYINSLPKPVTVFHEDTVAALYKYDINKNKI
jgi:hypothetical protein